jgi:hypothetical protein
MEAAASPTEMQRAMNPRIAVQELRQAGASSERRAKVAQLLDEAQTISINELATVSTPLPEADLADHTRRHFQGREPFEAFWLFAGIVPPPSLESAVCQANGASSGTIATCPNPKVPVLRPCAPD